MNLFQKILSSRGSPEIFKTNKQNYYKTDNNLTFKLKAKIFRITEILGASIGRNIAAEVKTGVFQTKTHWNQVPYWTPK